MPGKRATPAQTKRFFNLVERGMSPRSAGLKIGMSEAWGWRTMQGIGKSDNSVAVFEKRNQSSAPAPKQMHELRPEVQRMLQPEGFSDFCEAFLARRPAAWRQNSAELVVAWLMDRSERTYVDINTPPGAGKSTLFTCDIPLWLICGGGFADPTRGRAVRILLGHEVKKVSMDYVRRLRRMLDLRRPYFDKDQHRAAELVITDEFGRFRPVMGEGEESLWAQDQFLVAQMETVDLYDKEPTVQAASRQGGFLGERVDFYSWDDLATSKNSRSPEISDETDRWFEDEAETRLEPGGVGLLVGQRLGPLDLHRRRLDKTWVDEDTGEVHQRYQHIIYPAHHELTCSGDHAQWDLRDQGCLLDAERLPWNELRKIQHEPYYRTVFQQEDTDPGSSLVLPVWIEGGTDPFGFDAPGCYDRDRSFLEVPSVAPARRFINYACVDPSASKWWAIEWWALKPEEDVNFWEWYRYLIYGKRAKIQAGGPGGFLDWDSERQEFIGVMEDVQQESIKLQMPIQVWIIESNAAHRYLTQYDHFRRWKAKYPWVRIISHQTQKNKSDPDLGIEGRLRNPYREGLKRLPQKYGGETMNYMKRKVRELELWPRIDTDDTVMADWFGETNLETIVRLCQRPQGQSRATIEADFALPPYLARKQRAAMLTR